MVQEHTENIIKTGDLLDNESNQLVGSFLQRERLRKQFTLEDVAKETCIPFGIIQSIENNNRSKMPAPVFARGFIKLYAEFLGIESQEIVDRYNHEIDQFEDYISDSSDVFYNEKLAESSSFVSLRSCLVFLFLAMIFGLGYYFFLYSSPTQQAYRSSFPRELSQSSTTDEKREVVMNETNQTTDHETGSEEKNNILAPSATEQLKKQTAPENASSQREDTIEISSEPDLTQPTANEEPAAELLPEPEPAPRAEPTTDADISNAANTEAVEQNIELTAVEDQQKNLHLRIEFTERTWMQVSLDNAAPEQYLFDPADESNWMADKKIKLHIGNAGGVRLFLNDKELPVGGMSGSPLLLTIPDDLASNN